MCFAEEVIVPWISANEKSLDANKDNEEDPDSNIDIVDAISLQIYRYSIESFVNNPKAVLEFTGLENYEEFNTVLSSLGKTFDKLKYRSNVGHKSLWRIYFFNPLEVKKKGHRFWIINSF